MPTRRAHHKIVFAGPVGVGKTAAIASISDIEPIRTDEGASDMTLQRKAQTTVAMDYGMLRLPDGEKIMLYGTPGQERFDFMWDILTEGGIGLVLLLDNTRANPFSDMRFFLKAFAPFIGRTKVAIGVTHMDEQPQPALSAYRDVLREVGIPANVPLYEVDARSRRDIAVLVQSMLYSLDPTLEEGRA